MNPFITPGYADKDNSCDNIFTGSMNYQQHQFEMLKNSTVFKDSSNPDTHTNPVAAANSYGSHITDYFIVGLCVY